MRPRAFGSTQKSVQKQELYSYMLAVKPLGADCGSNPALRKFLLSRIDRGTFRIFAALLNLSSSITDILRMTCSVLDPLQLPWTRLGSTQFLEDSLRLARQDLRAAYL